MSVSAEKWKAYPKEIIPAYEVWNLKQIGNMESFDSAFMWSRPKTFTKGEHIEKYLRHLNERVSSMVADDGFVYIGVQWEKGNYKYAPRFFRFKYSDLPKGEDFFIIVKDKWGNQQLSVHAGLDTWIVQENRRQTYSGRNQGRYSANKSHQQAQNLMNKLMSGQTLTTKELELLQNPTPQEPAVAFIRDMEADKRPKWNVNLSKYYRQSKHRACLKIFKPSEAEVVRKIDLGLLNWINLSI
jgi:hypothetical protein